MHAVDPLSVECPKCRAGVGQKCKNYLGKGQAPHKGRGVDLAKHQKAADRKNAKLREEIPLFAALEPQATATGEYWHWRRNAASAAENVGATIGAAKGLQYLRLLPIRAMAKRLVGAEAFEKLADYCKRTYPCPETYEYGFWLKVLTGERLEFCFERVENRQPGEPAVRCVDWYEQKHLDREEYYRLFPYADPPEPATSDAELAVMAEADAFFQRVSHA